MGGFKFKQFEIEQDRCAMKVGTDGVLLGSWCGANGKVLDIGTGTGVVALMTAQRGAQSVDAIEIDPSAAEQAAENFSRSPWSGKLRVLLAPFGEFVNSTSNKYDTIVSNPPYFINSQKAEGESRSTARHTDSLPYDELASGVAKLLCNDGRFYAIFPYQESGIFIVEAAKCGLYVNKRLDVSPIVGRGVKRVLLEFSKEKITDVTTTTLAIAYDNKRTYTDKYMELTKDFYIKF